MHSLRYMFTCILKNKHVKSAQKIGILIILVQHPQNCKHIDGYFALNTRPFWSRSMICSQRLLQWFLLQKLEKHYIPYDSKHINTRLWDFTASWIELTVGQVCLVAGLNFPLQQDMLFNPDKLPPFFTATRITKCFEPPHHPKVVFFKHIFHLLVTNKKKYHPKKHRKKPNLFSTTPTANPGKEKQRPIPRWLLTPQRVENPPRYVRSKAANCWRIASRRALLPRGLRLSRNYTDVHIYGCFQK